MTSAILDTPDDDCVLAGLQAEDAQCETQGSADPTESFVQKTFGPATDSPFEEGRPWSPPAPDPFLAAFKEHLREAEALETQIGNNESSADQLLAEVKGIVAPLERQQILACYRAWKLVVEGNVPVSTMEEYTLTGGVKAHGNEKIPCSRLMRAIVKSGVITGTRSSQNKRARASTNASAIDFGIQKGMSEEEFAAELDQPRKRGEHHGIEYLAAEGRKVRQTAKTEQYADEISQALDGLNEGGAFSVSGDFSDVAPGRRLIVINVPAETTIAETPGQIIDPVDDALVQRILQKWIKARTAMPDANRSSPPIPINGGHSHLPAGG